MLWPKQKRGRYFHCDFLQKFLPAFLMPFKKHFALPWGFCGHSFSSQTDLGTTAGISQNCRAEQWTFPHQIRASSLSLCMTARYYSPTVSSPHRFWLETPLPHRGPMLLPTLLQNSPSSCARFILSIYLPGGFVTSQLSIHSQTPIFKNPAV